MEMLFKPCDKEVMKMAMLKHEQIFKQQVYELHELYRIQKLLMKSIEERKNASESEIELSLGLGLGPLKRKAESDCGPNSFSLSSSSTGSSNINRTRYGFNVEEEEHLRREQKHPPWFFQVLI